jgi:predicted nucleotidyltransferase
MKASGVQRKIDTMVRRIVKRFGPERIVLFGSHARGDAGPDSDVDLLVVMSVRGSKRNKAIEIAVALDDIRIPIRRARKGTALISPDVIVPP